MGTYRSAWRGKSKAVASPAPWHTHFRHFSHFSSILWMCLSLIFLDLGIENSKYALFMGLYICWLWIIYTQVHIPLLLSYQKAVVTWENRLLTGYFNEEREGEKRENGAYWTRRGNGVAGRSTEGTNDSWTDSKVGKKASFSILLRIGSIKRNYWWIFLTGTVWSI